MAGDLEFVITPRIKSAIDQLIQHFKAKQEAAEPLQKLQSLSQSDHLSFTDLQMIASTSTKTGLRKQVGWLHELMEGSTVWVPPQKKKPRNLAWEKRLAELKILQENREYNDLVKDLPSNAPKKESFKQQYGDIGIGVNVIAIMATGFVVFYYLGSRVFHDAVMPVLCGVVGLIAGMLLETVLFVVREEKRELRTAYFEKVNKEKKRVKRVIKPLNPEVSKNLNSETASTKGQKAE